MQGHARKKITDHEARRDLRGSEWFVIPDLRKSLEWFFVETFGSCSVEVTWVPVLV